MDQSIKVVRNGGNFEAHPIGTHPSHPGTVILSLVHIVYRKHDATPTPPFLSTASLI